MDKELEARIKQYMADGLDIGKWTHGGAIDCSEMVREVRREFAMHPAFLRDVLVIADEVATEYEAWMRSNIGGA